MLKIAPTVALAVALSLGVSAQEPATDQSLFPVSSALAESVSPDALARLDELVQSFVDDGDVVGAELLVIKNGRSILHEGYGLNDRKAGTAMGTGNVFCVRSMTKPLIGTSILMLVAEKKIKLSDPVSTYLPNFSGEGQRDITIENLLMHTSGLSMSQIMTADLTTIDGIQAVAEMGATAELLFEPGTNFNYSDQGTDTLTAVLEVVSGMTAADFVTTRILEPFGMEDSVCLMEEGNPLRERGCVKYVGSRGNWSSFWSPEDKPLFPFFLGSQGLYSTLEDYGLFMEFWMNKGRARSGRLLRPSFVRKALVPNPFQFPIPTGLPNVESSYGFLMQLWTRANEDETKDKRELVAFGHTGSDGTHAWVLPDEKAIVLYFTQSRGTITGLRVEEALGELFLGEAFDPNQAAPPFEDYLGYYAEGPGHRYQSVILDGDDLALETP
ncbi:MAG: CubicO group peptidase (beta-lactamase class C family), partial [Planctomycetota bacterium]